MKKFSFSSIFLIVFTISFSSFSQHTVQGNLQDKNQDPIAFANVVLFNGDSTSVYRGAVSDEAGDYIFEDVAPNGYVLSVSYMGYKGFIRRIEVNRDIKLENIILQEDEGALEEITVVGKRPTVSRSIDRLVFNVENSILSTGNTYEILKRTPGVIENQGQLLVKNRPAVVYINDRRVYLTSQELQQLLEGYSAENVKSVEVITNPPARYDAEGGAILNIRTSTNPSIGYKGSLNGSYAIGVYPKYLVGTSQYYKNDWVNVFAGYNLNARRDYKEDEGRIEFYEPNGTVNSRWLNQFERNTHTLTHSFNTILDFTLNEKSELSLSANLQLTPKSDSDIGGFTQILDPQNQPEFSYSTESFLVNNQDNILLDATYKTEFGENGASLTAAANFLSYLDERVQDLRSQFFSSEGEFISQNSFTTDAEQDTKIYSGRIDLTTPVGSSSLESGIKYSGIRSQSGMDFLNTNNSPPVPVENLSDDFDYDENIYAAYASISRDWENWSIKGGLRGEYTDVAGFAASIGPVNVQDYLELFPTFYIMRTVGEDHSFGLDYSRRIIRPRFQSLNPYRYFLNENNYSVGNPNLQPSISNKINFNYTYQNKLSFSLYWDRADDAIAALPFQDNVNRVLRVVNANMKYEQQYSLDVEYYDYVTNWWYLYAYGSLFHMKNIFIARESGNEQVTNETVSTYLMAQNYFTISKDRTLTGEFTASFLPNILEGSYRFEEPQTIISAGIRKSFQENRLVLTLNVDDILNRQNIPLSSQYLNQNNSFQVLEGETRRIRLGITYKFGNFRLQDNQRAIDIEEGSRLQEEEEL